MTVEETHRAAKKALRLAQGQFACPADRSAVLGELLNDPDPVKAQSVMQAMFQMKKIEIDKLKQPTNWPNFALKQVRAGSHSCGDQKPSVPACFPCRRSLARLLESEPPQRT